MTIIEPNKNSRKTNSFLFASVTALVAVSVWSVLVYSQTVGISHNLSNETQNHKAALEKNAELKNIKYQLTDTKNLLLAAEKSGLVKVANPEFIEVEHSLARSGN